MVTVYEAINRTLKEVLVGATSEPFASLRPRHEATRPPELSAWDFAAHEIEYREVERGVPARDLPTFLDAYARTVRAAGWTMRATQDGWLLRRAER